MSRYLIAISLVAIVFSKAYANESDREQSSELQGEIVSFIDKYYLDTTYVIEIVPVLYDYENEANNENGITRIDNPDDVQQFIDTLQSIEYFAEVFHACIGDYSIKFYTASEVFVANLGHHDTIQTDDGMFQVNAKFLIEAEKHLHSYYRDYKSPKE